jgi:hypothetical protein
MEFIQLDSFKEALQIIISSPSFQPILNLFNTSISQIITNETDILNFLIKIYSSFNKFCTLEHLSITFIGISGLLYKYLNEQNVYMKKEIKSIGIVLYYKYFVYCDINKNNMEQNLIEDTTYFSNYVDKMICLINHFNIVFNTINTTIFNPYQIQNVDTLFFLDFFKLCAKALVSIITELYDVKNYVKNYIIEHSIIKIINEIPICQDIQRFILYPYVKNNCLKKFKIPIRIDKPIKSKSYLFPVSQYRNIEEFWEDVTNE